MLKLFEDAARRHKRIIKYQFWTHENHTELVYSNKFITEKFDYIHNNPVESEIIEKPEEYLYLSAKNYAGEKG